MGSLPLVPPGKPGVISLHINYSYNHFSSDFKRSERHFLRPLEVLGALSSVTTMPNGKGGPAQNNIGFSKVILKK